MSQPTRVLINALHAQTGGGVTYLKALLPLLARRLDLRCRLLMHKNQRAIFSEIPTGIDVVQADFKDGFLRRLIWEQLILPLHAWAWTDVTFSPANFGPLLATRPVILLRNALEVEVHETRFSKRVYWKILRIMTWLSLLRAPLAGAVSDFAKANLSFQFSRKVRVLWHGVDGKRFFPPTQPRQDFILAVGDLTIQKNFTTLIAAVARIPGATLKIAGHGVDDAHAKQLRAMVHDLGLDGRVQFLGRVDPAELAKLYRSCRVFAFPSTVETFGNPLVEAMASGCPIICSQAAAMPEVLGDAGLYALPQNVPVWAALLGQLLGDAALRDDLSLRAVDRARLFSWEATAEQTASLLHDAARKPPSNLFMAMAWAWIVVVFGLYLLQYQKMLPAILEALQWF
ncbi:Glycosyltransferase [Rhodospirillaceae bacterium LM-1]|nr:Glycosyltransferase [Rhodospirillaceae bacterium LM-1]